MANDVSIIVSADLGDTLIKLDLAKHGVNDLGDASLETAAKQDEAAVSSGVFSDALAGLNGALSSAVPLLPAFSDPIIAIPAIVIGASVAVVALADTIGTLVAILGALVAPLTLVTGLLGILGAGFFVAAQKAFGMHEDGLGQAISGLKKQFDDLTTTLVGDFMPVFQFLIHNASQALDYLNRIAKLPLAQAFKSLATQGVPAVTKFLGQVGSMLAHPIRLAVQLAFGTGKGGNEISSAVSGLWKQFTDFLFGYQKSHPVELRPGVFKIKTTTVDGIFQPFLDWFNRHDFTKSGIEIGHDLLNGLKPFAKPLGLFIVNVFEDAFKTVIRNFATTIGRLVVEWSPFGAAGKRVAKEINDYLKRKLEQAMDSFVSKAETAWSNVKSLFVDGWNTIKQVAGDAITAIRDHLGNVKSAMDTVISGAKKFWGWLQKIANFFSNALTLNINWPTPPSWLTSLGGLIGGGSSTSTAGRTGQGGNSPGGHVVMHANFHYHAGGSSNDSASFRRFAREVGREIGRQNHILAGGQ